MPLMTKEDEKLYNILKQHDENGVLIDEEQFSELGDKKTPVDLVLAGLTERTSSGRMLGYKWLADRENEINAAYAAAEKERSNPDPSFNAAGMDELYDALEKEQRIENYNKFLSKDEFMQLKLHEKIKLVENYIEGATARSIIGDAYDTVAGLIGAQQYGTKMDREKALYSAAQALDSMLPIYQERNPDEPNIFPYEHRDIMNKLYGKVYTDLRSLSNNSEDLPSRGEFYAMSSKNKKDTVTLLTPNESNLDLNGGFSPNADKMEEIIQRLDDIDRNKEALTMDQWTSMDKLYGDIYSTIAEKANSKELPSMDDFYLMTGEEKENIVQNLIPSSDGRLDDFSFSINPKGELLNKLKAANKEAEKLHIEPYQMATDVNGMDDFFDANPEETRLAESAQPKRTNPYMQADVYVDHEAGERIQLKPEQSKEGMLFKFPEEPHETLIIEKGSEKTGFRFEPTQEAIEKKENITIETPCLDADGKEIPGKFEKLIFNPATNEMLLHKVPDGFNSRLDQDWLTKFIDKTPKSRSRVTIGANQDQNIHELSEENISQHNGKSNNHNNIDSLSVSSSDDDEKENLNHSANQAPKLSSMRNSLTAPTSTKKTGSTRIPTVLDPNKVAANMKKQTKARAKPNPQEMVAYLETEDGKFSLGKNSAGNFVLGSEVIIEVQPDRKNFQVKGKGKYIIDVPTSGGHINRHSYDKGNKISGPILTINPVNTGLNITIMDATTIDPPSSRANISMNKKGDRELL